MPKKKQSKTAAKGDVEQLRQEMNTKFEEARQERRQTKKEIIYEFKAAIEIIREELIGANKDEISAIKDKQEQHGQRIVRLEEHVGVL